MHFHCPKCGISMGAKKLQYTEEMVDKEIAKKGVTKELVLIQMPQLPFRQFAKRGHSLNLSFSPYLGGHSGCKLCANIERMGENSPNWKGGSSEVIDSLRKSLKDWKREVSSRDNYECVISQQHNDLVVHHLLSFNIIIEEASRNTGIPILRKLQDYDNFEDYVKLEEAVLNLHKKRNRDNFNKRHT